MIDIRTKYKKGDHVLVRCKNSEEVFECEWIAVDDWQVGCPLVRRLDNGSVIDIGYRNDLVDGIPERLEVAQHDAEKHHK